MAGTEVETLEDMVQSVLKRFKGKTRAAVATCLSGTTQKQTRNIAKAITDHESLIKRAKTGGWVYYITYALSETAKNSPESVDNVAHAIAQYNGEMAARVAHIFAHKFEPNNLKIAARAFVDHAPTIKTLLHSINHFGKIAENAPELIEEAAEVIRKYNCPWVAFRLEQAATKDSERENHNVIRAGATEGIPKRLKTVLNAFNEHYKSLEDIDTDTSFPGAYALGMVAEYSTENIKDAVQTIAKIKQISIAQRAAETIANAARFYPATLKTVMGIVEKYADSTAHEIVLHHISRIANKGNCNPAEFEDILKKFTENEALIKSYDATAAGAAAHALGWSYDVFKKIFIDRENVTKQFKGEIAKELVRFALDEIDKDANLEDIINIVLQEDVAKDISKLDGAGINQEKLVWSLLDLAKKCKNYEAPNEIFKKIINTVGILSQEDPKAGELLLQISVRIPVIFRDKCEDVLYYFVGRHPHRADLRKIGNFSDDAAEDVSKIKLYILPETGKPSYKDLDRLITFAWYQDCARQLHLETKVTEDVRTSLKNVKGAIESYMAQKNIKDIEKGLKFLPWIATEDETALGVLRGDKIYKKGIARTYEVESNLEFNSEKAQEDLQKFAKLAGIEIEVKEGEDLAYYQRLARTLQSEADRRALSPEALGEKKNLNRISNLIYKTGQAYTLSVDPSDLEAQMDALQNVGSCLSPPSGSMFKYTQEYMKNPYPFWAVIKNNGRAVGRVTILTGKDSKGNKAIARVSNAYPETFSENSIDKALRAYARESRAKYMTHGKLTVPGLTKFYDDFIGEGSGNVVEIQHNRAN